MKSRLFWVFLFFSPLCWSDVGGGARLKNELLITPPAPPHDQNFRHAMMKNIREIAMSELDDEDISKLMGWPKASKVIFDGGHEISRFNIYHELSNKPFLEISAKNNSLFDFSVDSSYVCLVGDDIVAEFGKKFKRAALSRDTFSDIENKKYYAGENYRRFGSGPVYEWIENNVRITVIFLFEMSECVDSVAISKKAY